MMYKRVNNHFMICLLACFLALAMLPLSGCTAQEEQSTGVQEISLINIRARDDKAGEYANADIDCYDRLIEAWQADHQETDLQVKTRVNAEVASLAWMGHLPDVFMLDAASGRNYQKYEFVLDLSEYIGDEYRNTDPFTYDGGVYAFPMLSPEVSLVAYDQRVFADGIDSWDDLADPQGFIRSQGYEGTLLFGASGYSLASALSSVLSPVLASQGGSDWFSQVVDGEEGVLLTDQPMCMAIDATRDLLVDDVFYQGYLERTPEEAMAAFVDGVCPAILVSCRAREAYSLLDKVKEENPALYENLGFASLPVGSASDPSFMASGPSYGLFINAAVADDPEKLQACIDLCRSLTGQDYANEMAATYGMMGPVEASETSWEAFVASDADETVKRLSTYTRQGMESCPMLTQYLHGTVWSPCFNGMASMVDPDEDDKTTTAIVTNGMQNAYEENYLRLQDFMELLQYAGYAS